jgi:hypothetical protein
MILLSIRPALPMHMMSAPGERSGECSALPLYTPSGPSPNYSCDPVRGERTLQQTPGVNHVLPTGTYYKKSGKVTVALFDQENDAEVPTYGQHGLVNGTVHLENIELVSHVTLEVCSDVLSFANGNSHEYRLKANWNQRITRAALILSNF